MTKHTGGSILAGVFLSSCLLFGVGVTAHAITFGPNCGSGNCFGSIYSLTSRWLVRLPPPKRTMWRTVWIPPDTMDRAVD